MADQELKQALIHGSPKIKLNAAHYERVAAGKTDRTLMYERVLEPQTGDASTVDAGQVVRYVSVWDTGIEPLSAPQWDDWEQAFYDAVERGDKDISPRSSEANA